ncbi:MAG: hypothetical protein U0802_00750 [Candidatus Binatia bacterium]
MLDARQHLARPGALRQLDRQLGRGADQLFEAGAAGSAQLASDDQARVDTEASRQGEPAFGLRARRRPLHLGRHQERGARRAAGVVLARLRVSEGDQDAVRHDARDVAAMAAGNLGKARVLSVHQCVELLHVGAPAVAAPRGQPTAHQGQLSALRIDHRRHLAGDGAVLRAAALGAGERLQEAFDGDVASVDGLGGDDLEDASDPLAAQPPRDRDGIGSDLLEDDLVRGRAVHGQLPGQALEEDQPPGVEVRAGQRGLAAQLLRGGVAGGAHHLTGRRETWQLPLANVARQSAEAEVEDQRVPARAGLGDHDVVRFEVAVDDAPQVRAAERIEHLAHQVDGLAHFELAFGGEDRLQGRARHELEHGVQDAVVRLARIDQADDVGMRELAAQAHLTAEAVGLHADVFEAIVRIEAQDLDRHLLAGRQLARLVDAAEAPHSELAENLVAPLEE